MIIWLVGVCHLHLSHQSRPAAHIWVATHQFRTTDLDQVRDREHTSHKALSHLFCITPLHLFLSLSVSFLWEVIRKTSAEMQPRLSTAAQNKLHFSQCIVHWCKARKERHYVWNMNKQAWKWKMLTFNNCFWIEIHFCLFEYLSKCNEINKPICSNTTSTEVALLLFSSA